MVSDSSKLLLHWGDVIGVRYDWYGSFLEADWQYGLLISNAPYCWYVQTIQYTLGVIEYMFFYTRTAISYLSHRTFSISIMIQNTLQSVWFIRDLYGIELATFILRYFYQRGNHHLYTQISQGGDMIAIEEVESTLRRLPEPAQR